MKPVYCERRAQIFLNAHNRLLLPDSLHSHHHSHYASSHFVSCALRIGVAAHFRRPHTLTTYWNIKLCITNGIIWCFWNVPKKKRRSKTKQKALPVAVCCSFTKSLCNFWCFWWIEIKFLDHRLKCIKIHKMAIHQPLICVRIEEKTTVLLRANRKLKWLINF